MSRADVLVDADWVLAHLGDPAVVVVEVNEDTTPYDRGHIPGAVKLDWKKALADPVQPDFAVRARFEALLTEWGIANDDTMILYGSSRRSVACAYWYFKIYGHRDVRLLDGGRKEWEVDSRQMLTQVRCRPPTAHRAWGMPAPRAAPRPGQLTGGAWVQVLRPVYLVFHAMSACASSLLAAPVGRHHRHDAHRHQPMALVMAPGRESLTPASGG